MQRQMGRRHFLQTAGVAILACLSYPFVLRRRAQARGLSPAVQVLVADLRQGPAELAAGSVQGLRLSSAGLSLAPAAARGTYLSPPLPSPFPFTHVGLHWLATNADDGTVQFQVRASVDGITWSPWQNVHIEALPGEAANDENYGALVGAQRATYIQYRAELAGAGGGPLLAHVVVTLLNSRDGPRLTPATTAPATAAVGGKPITFTREEWGADEKLRFRGRREIWPRAYVSTKKVVVQHTARGNDYETVEDAKAEVRAIYTYHTRTLGWGDIGYNSLVDNFGNSYEGRHGRDGPGYDGPGGREILSEDVVAGHASSHNYGSTGVALLGTFCSTDECAGGTTPSETMVGRLKDILVWECGQHQIDPHGDRDFLLSADAWNRDLLNICGHRDCNSTICPGENVYALLPSLRDYVAGQLNDTSGPTVTIIAYPLEATITDGKASYTWYDAGGSGGLVYSYYLEGWFKPSNSADINYLSGYNENKEPDWSDWTNETTKSFSGLEDGHYTFHVLTRDSAGTISAYQDNRTLLAKLSAQLSEITVTNIHLNAMQAGTTIDVTISGSGFASGADVTFENGAGPAPTASNIVVDGANTITAMVTARSGGPPRKRVWDLRVTNPDGASGVLVDGFTVDP